MDQKHLIFIFNTAPYSSPIAREGLDALLAAAIFDQRISVLFIGDGVFQLLENQDPDEQKNYAKMLKSLAIYDINACYAHIPSIEARGLKMNSPCIPIVKITDHETRNLIISADHALSF